MTDPQITLDARTIQALLGGDPDALRQLAQDVLNKTLQAEMDDHLGAQRYERCDERTGSRNGSYKRDLTTRVGPLTLRVPRDRDGNFSSALFERYSRTEKALVATLVEMVVQGVSTRKVTKITQELCGKDFSKSTVSRLTQDLDECVQAWRQRPLDDTEYVFLLVDALYFKVRENNQVVSRAMMIAVGITSEGTRRILGCELGHAENERDWAEFFSALKERGLSGVALTVSDAHAGLVEALAKVFTKAAWQRCQTHFKRNVLDAAPKRERDELKTGLDTILLAESKSEARAALEQVLEKFEGRRGCERALSSLERGWEGACTVLELPQNYRKRLRTTNMVERLNGELRRRDRVIRIYPNGESAIRLMGAQLVEHDEKWMSARTYLDMEQYHEWVQARDSEQEPRGRTGGDGPPTDPGACSSPPGRAEGLARTVGTSEDSGSTREDELEGRAANSG